MPILLEEIDDLIPIAELSPENRNRLAEKGQIVSLKPRQSLDGAGSDRWLIYLLDGQLAIKRPNGQESIASGTPRAKRPLFSDERPGSAVAQSACRLLRLDRRLFEIILREQREGDYQVEDTPISEEEGTLLAHILRSLNSGNLELPSMPEVALRIRDATLRPEISLKDIAKIVQIDPAVAAGVLRAANTAARHGAQPATTLPDAVVRLGLETTRSLAISLALTTVFHTKQAAVRQRMHALWEHSVHVSALCQTLAERCAPALEPSHAMLAGLLHDIGAIPILQHAERYGLLGDAERLESAIVNLRVPVGMLIVDHWQLNSDLQAVIQCAEDWKRGSGSEPDYADLVVAAQLMLPAQQGVRDTRPPLDEVPAFARLGLAPSTPERMREFLDDAQQDIDEIKHLLGG
ncbi:HDOD domain-containing protein [Acidihalobacter prosperus]|uniref:HDOD domain-containing protein n=1 Tax=Acidihalobacter prosperus TaxID=160660 RepID=A0A1A6C0G2_9GAMM|nr:HDOD domain-containing protein [Acidihalobacter prosperus]OBS08044.1 hypothetical protein Thpro_022294 [Acidihalobacter prosperus]